MAEQSKGMKIGFWILTGLLCLSQGASGVMDLVGAAPVKDGVLALGYPAYILYILGPWKLAGAIVIGAPGMAKYKEWAYAGFFFDFTGAALSHVMNGDGIDMIMPPLVLCAIMVGSYVLRPADRRLPV